MKIDTNTKLIARLHTTDNGTGLNIYNPYFQDQGVNAVYLLFKNKNAKPLIDGLRNLQVSGAITAGFEHDPELPKHVDKTSETVKLVNRVGIVFQNDGVLTAHYQGGEGLLSAIQEKADLTNKQISIIGAGTVAGAFLLALKQKGLNVKVSIYNRSINKAEVLQEKLDMALSVNSLDELENAHGDILINASSIGSKVEDRIFTSDIVTKFSSVADVTFGVESTNLTKLAIDNSLTVISGWDMFTHPAVVVLKHILNHEANVVRLRHFVRRGLGATN